MAVWVSTSVEGFARGKKEPTFVRAIANVLGMRLSEFITQIIIRPGQNIKCYRANKDAICISTDNADHCDFVVLSICKLANGRGSVRLYPKGKTTIADLQKKTTETLKIVAKNFEIHIAKNGKTCALKNTPTPTRKPRHKPLGPIHPDFPNPVWIAKPSVRRLYLILLGLGQANSDSSTLLVKSYSIQLNARKGQQQLDGWWIIGLQRLKTHGLIKTLDNDNLLVFRVQLADNPTQIKTKKISRPETKSVLHKEKKEMSKNKALTGRRLQVFQTLIEIAGGENGELVLVEGYNTRLKEELPKDFPRSSICGVIASLKKEGLVQTAGRGNIKVKCINLGSKKEREDPEPTAVPKKNAEKEGSTKAEQNLEGCCQQGSGHLDLTPDNLIKLFGNKLAGPFDAEALIKQLFSLPIDPAVLRTIYRLERLSESYLAQAHDNPNIPNFEEKDGKVKMITTL